jgi:hypothetical protein
LRKIFWVNHQQHIHAGDLFDVLGYIFYSVLIFELLDNSPGRFRIFALHSHHLGHISADLVAGYLHGA